MIRRLVMVLVGLLLVSMASVMTAGLVVPESNAGLAVLALEPGCVVPSAAAMSPKNLNRRSAAHHTLTATLSFPGGLPPGSVVGGVTMSLAGGVTAISPNPGGGPEAFTFSRDDVLSLVGPTRGDYTFEISGQVGGCTFAAQDTIRLNGPES